VDTRLQYIVYLVLFILVFATLHSYASLSIRRQILTKSNSFYTIVVEQVCYTWEGEEVELKGYIRLHNPGYIKIGNLRTIPQGRWLLWVNLTVYTKHQNKNTTILRQYVELGKGEERRIDFSYRGRAYHDKLLCITMKHGIIGESEEGLTPVLYLSPETIQIRSYRSIMYETLLVPLTIAGVITLIVCMLIDILKRVKRKQREIEEKQINH